MSIAVKSGLPSLGSTEGAVISADEVSVSEDGSAAASVGEDLPRGKSAYEIAKENGFNGTETEWLASLKGEPGAAGASGKDGENGKTPYVGDNGNWYIGADDTGKPSRGAKGDKGEKGEKGDTGAQGIQGEKGDTGAQGPQGAAGADGKTPYVGDNGNWFVGSDDTGKPSRGEKGEPGSPGAKGDKGDPGATPNLTIGSVTTLDAGQNATASMGGTAESPVLNLGIPRGAKGEPGEGGGGTYYVELDGNFPNYTLSETTPLADIAAAYNDGKTMFCRCSMGSFTATLPLFVPIAELNTWIFSGSGGAAVISFPAQYFTIIVSAQGVTAENKRLVRTDAIVSSVSASSTHDDVPSAKCVYDELQERSLKQATSDTLGGVKADPATAYDTQPVRIDDSGKLVTAAGGADISLGLTSAAVGQTIKVKAIDESGKPTAWEAANMQSGDRWELINAIEIPDGAEETNALRISADKNGNAFSLKKARLITYFPKYTGESSIPGYSITMVNGFTTGPQATLTYTSGLPVPNNSKNPEGWLEVDLSMPGYQVERVARFEGSGRRPTELMFWGARRLNGAETITSIGGISMLIYPGCKFTLYGVRA